MTVCGANKILAWDDGRVQVGGVVGSLRQVPEVIAKDPRLGVGLGEEGAVSGSNTTCSQEYDAPGGQLVEEHAGSENSRQKASSCCRSARSYTYNHHEMTPLRGALLVGGIIQSQEPSPTRRHPIQPWHNYALFGIVHVGFCASCGGRVVVEGVLGMCEDNTVGNAR